jgi:D-alanyl-D-alanine carboxypeptidase (penicillin-binding protein 5/6)
LPEIRRPLVSAEDVAIGGFLVRMLTVGGIVLKDVINKPLESM